MKKNPPPQCGDGGNAHHYDRQHLHPSYFAGASEDTDLVVARPNRFLKAPPPPSSLKPAPSPPSAAAGTSHPPTTFEESFDEEFIRQQQEIMANIQRQQQLQQHQDVSDDRSRGFSQGSTTTQGQQRFRKTQHVTPSPPKDRPAGQNSRSYNNDDTHGRTSSRYSHDSVYSSSQYTVTTATNTSRRPPSLYGSVASSISSSGGAVKVHTNTNTIGTSSATVASSSSATPPPKTDSETDISAFLDDAAMIREQQRILEQIQQQQQQASSSQLQHRDISLRDHAMQLDESTAQLAAASLSHNHSNISTRQHPQLYQQQDQIIMPSSQCTREYHWLPPSGPSTMSTSRPAPVTNPSADLREKRRSAQGPYSKLASSSHQHHHMEDRNFQVGQKNLRVQGTRKAYDAIATGNAIIVQCATCQAILQIASSAKLLYCTLCENVTPVDLAREQAVTDPRTNNSTAAANDTTAADLDERISRTLQNQEQDVACARKMAKMSSSSSSSSR